MKRNTTVSKEFSITRQSQYSFFIFFVKRNNLYFPLIDYIYSTDFISFIEDPIARFKKLLLLIHIYQGNPFRRTIFGNQCISWFFRISTFFTNQIFCFHSNYFKSCTTNLRGIFSSNRNHLWII